MKKSIVGFLTLLLLVGCGSSQTKTDKATGPTTENIESQSEVSEESVAAAAAPEVQPPSVRKSELKEALQSGNNKKLEEVAAKILAHDPKDTSALLALGVMHYKEGRPAMARLLYKKVIEIDPKNAGVHNNYGLTYLQEDEEGKALLEFKKALDLDSDNYAAAANAGTIHLKYKNYEEAKKLLETAYDKKSNSAIANNFALALRGTGDTSTAKRVFERLLDKDSKNTSILLNYASLLVENLNDKTKGQEIINKIKFLGTDPVILEKAKQLEAKIK